jgi:thiamine-phosphate pyrophosphorylase
MSQPMEAKRPAPRLYLATPPVDDVDGFSRVLADGLAAGDIAAVLLRLRPADERTLINRIKALTAVVQPTGAALVLDGHADLVARAGADGAHLAGIEAFTAALDRLKPERIAGCGGVHTRHDAMVAAERGADYVMFGDPESGQRRPALETILERIAWWAEVFQIPCVGLAENLDEVGRLTAAGADFIALGEWVWSDPSGVVAAIAAASDRLAGAESAA